MKNRLPPWEELRVQILWNQLGYIAGKRILDFGSGIGISANHYAKDNEVVAVEPDEESIRSRLQDVTYCQICGSTEVLKGLEDASFDWIFCHNVLEYAKDRREILREFHRLLKPEGTLSILKHNRPGRVMQMMVLLDDFDRANALLDGGNGHSTEYGDIRYYADEAVLDWCDGFALESVRGLCTFWRLQQKQEKHSDPAWQEKMVALDLRVSTLEPYRSVAFFHHLILKKKSKP
ncbi:MAG: class I SAM-dependent methyltransferase [Clostridia bacterium]|nr:class I SAM-dependent methyltransferase [Clostridia bacterium]